MSPARNIAKKSTNGRYDFFIVNFIREVLSCLKIGFLIKVNIMKKLRCSEIIVKFFLKYLLLADQMPIYEVN